MTAIIEEPGLNEASLITDLDKETILEFLYRRTWFVDNPENIHKTAIIGDDATLTGDLSIGAYTVVFSKAMLQADSAPIVIGDGCCIVDGVTMHNRVTIGDYVHIAHNCIIHRRRTQGALTIGSGTLVGFGAQVHDDIGKGCQIAPGVIIDQPVPDYHFVYDKHLDNGMRQTVVSPMRPANYHRVKAMYKNFWNRQIVFMGALVPLSDWWDRQETNIENNSIESAVNKLESFFNSGGNQ